MQLPRKQGRRLQTFELRSAIQKELPNVMLTIFITYEYIPTEFNASMTFTKLAFFIAIDNFYEFLNPSK